MSEHELHHTGNSLLQAYLPLVLLAVVLLSYLTAVFRLYCLGQRWHKWAAFSFVSGIALLGLGLSPGLSRFAHEDFRGHMLQHLLIGMLAPLGLVLGAPITLALKTLPARIARKITRILKSFVFCVLSHPFTAFLLNIGGMYALYLSPLYRLAFSSPLLHHLIHVHFLLAGYLFTWSMVGPDPAPRRPPFRTRLLVLFLSMAAHAYLSKFMYAFLYPLQAPHPATQIRSGAKLMYYGGDLSEVLLAIALFFFWYQKQKARRPAGTVINLS